MDHYLKDIKSRKSVICVWGSGYIGLSTLGFYAKKNIRCVGYDVNRKLIHNLSEGKVKNDDFKKWLGFEIKPLIKKKNLKFTNNINVIKKLKPSVHFVCIPTERNGKPYKKILVQVIKQIKKISKNCIIIIESTLTPGTSDKVILKLIRKEVKDNKFIFAVAPRRDWFVDGSKNLINMDRVAGSCDKKSNQIIKKILSIVCKKIHMATSYKEAEMVKSFENAYRHVDIALANQLSLAYPKENIREVLKLVGTKWNIGTFYPGFGSGGYCIPLSSKYVLEGSKLKNKLSILKETIKTDTGINKKIAKSIIKNNFKNIGILGLSYKSNLKVSTLSPVISLCEELKKTKANVQLFDPYFNKDEIKDITGCKSFSFNKDLKKFDCIVYTVNHNFFIKNKNFLLKNINCRLLLDNTNEFQKNKKFFFEKNIKLKIFGDKNWL